MNGDRKLSLEDILFGDQENNTDDVSLESANAARQMPAKKTVKVEAYDTELGWTEDYVTVETESDDDGIEDEEATLDLDDQKALDELSALETEIIRIENEKIVKEADGEAERDLKWYANRVDKNGFYV